jgi:hypothetical protein
VLKVILSCPVTTDSVIVRWDPESDPARKRKTAIKIAIETTSPHSAFCICDTCGDSLHYETLLGYLATRSAGALQEGYY